MTWEKFWIETGAGVVFGSGMGYAAYSGWLEAASVPGDSVNWAVAIALITWLFTYIGIEILTLFVLELFSS